MIGVSFSINIRNTSVQTSSGDSIHGPPASLPWTVAVALLADQRALCLSVQVSLAGGHSRGSSREDKESPCSLTQAGFIPSNFTFKILSIN